MDSNAYAARAAISSSRTFVEIENDLCCLAISSSKSLPEAFQQCEVPNSVLIAAFNELEEFATLAIKRSQNIRLTGEPPALSQDIDALYKHSRAIKQGIIEIGEILDTESVSDESVRIRGTGKMEGYVAQVVKSLADLYEQIGAGDAENAKIFKAVVSSLVELRVIGV